MSNHRYFESPHYKQLYDHTEQSLLSLGYNAWERKAIQARGRKQIEEWLASGEMVYVRIGDRELVFTRKESTCKS